MLHLSNEDTARLVEDPRLPVVSFTGSGPVGWGIKERVPRKHVTLELGGNAAAIVAPDWQDVEFAAQRIATFAMYQAGQSCISVQRVYVHTDVYDAVAEAVVQHVNKLDVAGDVGPLINDAAADRVEAWVNEAQANGPDRRHPRRPHLRSDRADGRARGREGERRGGVRPGRAAGQRRLASRRRSTESTLLATACRQVSSPTTCGWLSVPRNGSRSAA